jgi:hypothetical protein
VPRLKAAWMPARLTFVARGVGPFVVAIGNNLAVFGETPMADITSETNEIARGQASMGEFVESGGPAKLVQRPQTDWKRWILWAVLLIGVALLFWMARRLVREMRNVKQ